MENMKNLTGNERYIFDVIYKRRGYASYIADSSNIAYIYYKQGNFTVCILKDTKSNKYSTGIAKRHPNDQPNEDLGKKIAFARAVHNLIDSLMPKAQKRCLKLVLKPSGSNPANNTVSVSESEDS